MVINCDHGTPEPSNLHRGTSFNCTKRVQANKDLNAREILVEAAGVEPDPLLEIRKLLILGPDKRGKTDTSPISACKMHTKNPPRSGQIQGIIPLKQAPAGSYSHHTRLAGSSHSVVNG
jgi:hypothetical protein